MKIHGAVLHAMGAATPYAQSKPLAIEAVELDAPGPGEVLVKIAAAGPVPLGSLRDQRRPAAADADGARPRSGRHRRSDSVPASTISKRGDHVVMVFVPSCGHCAPCAEGRPALCEPGAVANAAGTLLGGHAATAPQRPAARTTTGRAPAFAEYATVSRRSLVKIDPELPLDRSGAVRLRGAHRRRRGRQHREARAGADRGGDRAGRRRARRAARRGRGGRAPHRRDRPGRRQAANWRKDARRDRHASTRRPDRSSTT